MDEQPTLMTTEEVARYLNVDPVTVRRLVQARDLPAIKVGRLLRFDPQAVRAWLEAQRRGGRESG